MTDKKKQPLYSEAKRDRLVSAISLRIYGVPLEEATTLESYTVIWWCGFADQGREQRKPTKQLWHLPKEKIIGFGEVEGFTFEGHQVQWFDVHREIIPIEETYVAVSLKQFFYPQLPTFRAALTPTISPEGPTPTISPEGPTPTISPEGPTPTVSPEGPTPIIQP